MAGQTGGEFAVKEIDTGFMSGGVSCAGSLYLPEGVTTPPVVIMAHGFAAERSFRLEAFAERFVERGLASFLFDYRGFGDSAGEPRQLVQPSRHLADWQAALAHVRGLGEIDARRIALWGSSFSGGHIVVTAARDGNVAAIVAQVPYFSSPGTLSRMPLKNLLGLSWAGLRDLGRSLLGRSPYCIPAVGRPGELAVMTTPESYDGYMGLVPPGSRWRNSVPARIGLLMPFYNPVLSAARVRCPTLIVAGIHDSLIPVSAVRRTANRIPQCELVELDCSHFQPYYDQCFDEVARLETAFLCSHLQE